MENPEVNPYENIELLTKVVQDNIKTIERYGYKMNENELIQFVGIVKLTMSMNQALVSDSKSKDAALKGFIQLLNQG
jgi:hypothetical protein